MTDRDLMTMALEFCEFVWRDVSMNDYAFERLEQTITALRERLAQSDRQELQADGKHPAPCARFCEATAFKIEIRNLDRRAAEYADLNDRQARRIAELEGRVCPCFDKQGKRLTPCINEMLARQEQEPRAFIRTDRNGDEELEWERDEDLDGPVYGYTPLYTAPQPAVREWVGLTDDEMNAVFRQAFGLIDSRPVGDQIEFVRAIEAKLREKNGGGQ